MSTQVHYSEKNIFASSENFCEVSRAECNDLHMVSVLRTCTFLTMWLHAMQCTVLPRPFSQFVHLSICQSVCQTCGLWQNKRNFAPHSYTTWKIIHPNFLIRRMVGVVRLLLPEILGQTDPAGAKTPIFSRYSLIAPQPQHLAKKFS